MHPTQMSEQPQVASFVTEAQQLYLESLSNDELLTLSLRQNPTAVQRKPFLPFIHARIQDKEYTSLWPSKALFPTGLALWTFGL